MAAIKHKVGEFYFSAWFDDETGKVEIEEYGLRSVRKGIAYFTNKSEFTWGKRSKKHGDFGWLPRIPTWARASERIGSEGANRYARTKAQAIRAAIAAERKTRAHLKDRPEIVADCDRAIAALQARLKRTRK